MFILLKDILIARRVVAYYVSPKYRCYIFLMFVQIPFCDFVVIFLFVV